MDPATAIIKEASQYGLGGLLVLMLFYVFREFTKLTNDFKHVVQESTKTLTKLNENLNNMNTKIDSIDLKVEQTKTVVTRVLDKVSIK